MRRRMQVHVLLDFLEDLSELCPLREFLEHRLESVGDHVDAVREIGVRYFPAINASLGSREDGVCRIKE